MDVPTSLFLLRSLTFLAFSERAPEASSPDSASTSLQWWVGSWSALGIWFISPLTGDLIEGHGILSAGAAEGMCMVLFALLGFYAFWEQ